MSLATRCTACGTIFRVVQDQLRVSEGWVRCGRCAEVFDAREQLFDIDREAPPPWPIGDPPQPQTTAIAPEPAPAPPVWTSAPTPLPPVPVPAPLPPAPPSPMFAEPEAQIDAEAEAEFEPEAEAVVESAFDIVAPADDEPPIRQEPAWVDEHPPIAAETAAAAPAAPAFFQPQDYGTDTILAPGLADAAATLDRADHTEGEAEAEATPPAKKQKKKLDRKAGRKLDPEAPHEASAASTTTTPAAPPVPEFMRRAQRDERWRRPGVRLALGAGVAASVVLLALQFAQQFHDAIVAVYPASRPAVEALCSVTGCKLEPWRRIDVVGVEASALNQAGPNNQYQLSLSLRNKSALEVATPWVELSLTDASGATVARRMLAPTEFKGGKAAMAPGAELPMQLLLATGEQRVAGYSVEIFHP